MGENRHRHTVWMDDAVWDQVESHYQKDNCSTKNEYIEKAIQFYSGYLNSERAGDYLPRVLADVLEGKLDLAKSLGADVVVNSREEDPVAKVKALTGGRGADVVVEAAGTAESFNAASAMIRHNGKFVFYSWVTTPVTLNISRWHDDGLEFVNTCLVHHTWQQRYVWVPDTLRPIIQGTVRIKPLITNEFKLADIKTGFDLADKDDAAIKIVFRP